MFFAYVALRPVAASFLDPPQRLPLWAKTFARFFPWVWIAVILLPLSGYWMIFAFFGGMTNAGLHIHIMNGLGTLMILLFLHLYFAPFRRLKEALIAQDLAEASRRLNQIRQTIAVNLSLGLIVIVIASAGRYL
jgi:uncharacterized membrane protein